MAWRRGRSLLLVLAEKWNLRTWLALFYPAQTT
jgi:hypothetical protein